MRCYVNASGGAGSFDAARRAVARFGKDNVTLVFADTRIEDPSLYRFLDQTRELLGCELVRVVDGRTPWQVFRDERYIGNTRADPCSKILKRDVLDAWKAINCDPATDVMVFGLDQNEPHRIARVRERMAAAGWQTWFPLEEPPWFDKNEVLAFIDALGIEVPRLYRLGFSHNNCGGFCVKAGQGHFLRLLETLPDIYAHHEAEEEQMRQFLGRTDIAVLRDRRGGKTKPLTLRDLRLRAEQDRKAGTESIDRFDIGGCGCFGGEGEEPAA